MWHHVCPVRINMSEEAIASIFRVERISELGTALAVTSNWSTVGRNNDDGGHTFLWKVSSNKTHMMPHPKRRNSTVCETFGVTFIHRPSLPENLQLKSGFKISKDPILVFIITVPRSPEMIVEESAMECKQLTTINSISKFLHCYIKCSGWIRLIL
jgi:hypothetical protein